jgi:hypothetical protein
MRRRRLNHADLSRNTVTYRKQLAIRLSRQAKPQPGNRLSRRQPKASTQTACSAIPTEQKHLKTSQKNAD